MKILHVVGSLDSRDGGAVQVVLGLTQALARNNVDVTIFAPNHPGEEVKSCPGVRIRYFKTSWYPGFLAKDTFGWGYSRSLAKALREEAPVHDLIHTHGIWHYPHYAVYRAAKCFKKPYMTTVHGEISPWGLERKNPYSLMIQKRALREASAIHAVSKNEAQDIAKFTDNPNISVIPNGINPQEFEGPISGDRFFATYPHLRGKKVVIFLGRINTGKGLETLAQAFTRVIQIQEDTRLLIVGPDKWGYQSKIEKIFEKEGILDKATFTGMLRGIEKFTALSCADIFVNCSESEGFSITNLEAMCCGLPIIISPQCNFSEVKEAGAGKIIEADVGQLTKSLLELLDNPKACQEMGMRGRDLVRNGEYYYDNIAKKMIEIYTTVISKY